VQTYNRHRLERYARRIEELRLWRNAYEILVKGWRFVVGEGEPKEIDPGDFWPEVGISVRLSARATVPQKWAGLPVGQWQATWYEPFEEQEYVDAAVSLVLARGDNGHPHRRGRRLDRDYDRGRKAPDAARGGRRSLSRAPDYSPPFISVPFRC
jgi:hypothetical protein